MAMTRPLSPHVAPGGPHAATPDDIAALNDVFSEAFTDRYRRDGMGGVRVPFLNPRIWRYAIEDAAEGAMVWRDERGGILGFNMVHRSGTEGWMGPLAVRRDAQGNGLGKTMVSRGIDWLRERGARVIGLETMPRTMDNIGFYAKLGFLPGRLTITVSINASRDDNDVIELSRVAPAGRNMLVGEAADLLASIAPGYDYTREILLTSELNLGDLLLMEDRGRLIGYALAHIAPLVEGRSPDEVRVLKLVLEDERSFGRLARGIAAYARRLGAQRVSFRLQGEYGVAFRQAVELGGRVRWTDLRMALAGFEDVKPELGVVLSNWEI